MFSLICLIKSLIYTLPFFLFQGDTGIFAYEIIAEPPHLFKLSQIKVSEAHQVSLKCPHCGAVAFEVFVFVCDRARRILK